MTPCPPCLEEERGGAIYLAAAYPRRREMRGYAAELVAAGYTVTSRWMDQDFGDGSVREVEERARFADLDLNDISRSDLLLVFTDMPSTSGGYHIEFGVAWAWQIECWIVGPRLNVFHCLPGLVQHDTWEEARAELLLRRDAEVCR